MAGNDSFDDFVDDLLEHGEASPPTSSPKGFLADLEKNSEESPHWAQVTLCTTPTLPGRTISETRGLVSGRIVKGQGPWANLKMAFGSDSFGKRSGVLEADFLRMEQDCFKQIKMAAYQKGANSVVGVSVQFGETSGEANLFYAVAVGTAVVVE